MKEELAESRQEIANDSLVEIKNIKKYYPIKSGLFKKTVGHVKAVDDISLAIKRGETLGIVGESGSGKSTLGRTILQLLPSTGGQVLFEGQDISKLKQRELRAYRRHMQMIFQDPFGSLNAKMSVRELIEEPLVIQTNLSKQERNKKAEEMMEKIGLRIKDLQKYPHEFSGGQRQRISIARALIIQPKFVVCDEAVSALDVSIQAQILNIMKDLQEDLKLTYLFISHDLSVVKHMSDRVAVMYLGRIVEFAPKKDIYNEPLHPYSQALLSAVPVISSEEKREKITLSGDLPSPANPPSGCAFRTRCPAAYKKCEIERPELKEIKPGHYAACHLHNSHEISDECMP